MKYDAFISYRHLEKDMFVAKKVHKALETTKIPRKIQKEIGRKKIDRVFRDQEELPIGSDLGSNIEAALQEAAFLVVICSPQTKESYWVMKEIDTFIQMHGRENVLAVLVDGEPGESFPSQLLTDENGNPVEPLAADVRGKNNREISKKLKTESLRLAASILHVDYDDLRQRHRERQMRRNVSIAAGVAALAVAFGVYNAYNLSKINAEYQEKLINESKVLAATSTSVLESGDRQTAALLAMSGLPTEDNDRPFVAESMYALSQALDCYDIGNDMQHDKLLTHHLQVDKFIENTDGTKAISYDTAKYVYLWDLETGEKLFEIPTAYNKYDMEQSICGVGFSDTNAIVISNDGITAYDDNGDVVYNYLPDGGVIGGKVFQKNHMAVMHSSDEFTVVDTNTGKIIKQYKNHLDQDFFTGYALQSEGKYVAVMHQGMGEEEFYCTVYNLETDEYKDLKLLADTQFDMAFTVDGQFAIITKNYSDIASSKDAPMYLQKFDVSTGAELWDTTIIDRVSLLNTTYTYVRSVNTVIAGEECARIMANNKNTIYFYDLYTGEETNTISTDSDIQRIGFNMDGTYLFVGTADGNVTIYPVDPNRNLTNNVIKVTDSIMIDYDIQGGVLVASSYRSPELTVMRYETDESMLYKSEMDVNVSSICDVSPDEKTYIIENFDYSDSNNYKSVFYVMDSANGQTVATFETASVDAEDVRYIDNDTILVPDKDGTVGIYHIKDKSYDTQQVMDTTSIDYYYTSNGKYLLVYDVGNYAVYSIPEFKEIERGNLEKTNIFTAVLSNDGKTMYYSNFTNNYSLEKANVKSGKTKTIADDYRVQMLDISNDDQHIAAAGNDGLLRIYDTNTLDTIDKVEYFSRTYSGLVKFSEDGNLLFLQAADLYLRIYDLTKKEFVFESATQSREYAYYNYDEVNNRLILSNVDGMTVIDLNTLGELSYIRYGRFLLPKTQTIISISGKNIYAFKFKELDELMKEAKELYDGKELTESQKLRYRLK